MKAYLCTVKYPLKILVVLFSTRTSEKVNRNGTFWYSKFQEIYELANERYLDTSLCEV